jgi:hypothetical protein
MNNMNILLKGIKEFCWKEAQKVLPCLVTGMDKIILLRLPINPLKMW